MLLLLGEGWQGERHLLINQPVGSRFAHDVSLALGQWLRVKGGC